MISSSFYLFMLLPLRVSMHSIRTPCQKLFHTLSRSSTRCKMQRSATETAPGKQNAQPGLKFTYMACAVNDWFRLISQHVKKLGFPAIFLKFPTQRCFSIWTIFRLSSISMFKTMKFSHVLKITHFSSCSVDWQTAA
jgi:hypothetical protein